MQKLHQHVSPQVTPQSEPIPGSTQVPNSAGGYAWEVDCWTKLRRFLILGTEGGSYYATERKLTQENVDGLRACLAADGPRAVSIIREISLAGRAPKNDPAIFALAVAASSDDLATRILALTAIPDVCRIGTHLFHFVEYVLTFRRWGRGLRSAIGAWYTGKDPKTLAYQLLKYQSRDGWSHGDLLRLAHPKPTSDGHDALFSLALGKAKEQGSMDIEVWNWLGACHELKTAEPKVAAQLIARYRLPREVVPTELLQSPEVWEALLADMPMTALIRNLATLTRIGLVGPLTAGTRTVCEQLADTERLRKARVHPIQLLSALLTYKSGHGVRGGHSWSPVGPVVDALNEAFYASFGFLEPTNLRWLLALDVSGSMSGGEVAGVPGLTPRVASSAMAMVTARTEQQHHIVGFSTTLMPLTITPKSRLDTICRYTEALPFSGTDCALPMLYALEKKIQADVFVVYTDSETWHGHIHPAQALRKYREQTGIPAKLIVCGMVANKFSIADPKDAGMLDVIGFDTATPDAMGLFARGAV